MSGITVRSPAFGDHGVIPVEYSHERGDVSPPLEWADLPDGTAELELICEDPDAPGGSFTHWVLAKIPPTVSGIGAGEEVPGAVTGRNDFGTRGYGGPHPPPGARPHRYVFSLYAVREPLQLHGPVTAEQLRASMRGKELASGAIVGTYAR